MCVSFWVSEWSTKHLKCCSQAVLNRDCPSIRDMHSLHISLLKHFEAHPCETAGTDWQDNKLRHTIQSVSDYWSSPVSPPSITCPYCETIRCLAQTPHELKTLWNEGGPERTPGIGRWTGVVTATLSAGWLLLSQWWSRRTGSWWGTGIVNRSHTAAVSGASRRHMRPYCCDRTCVSMMICRLCIRAIACLSMIEGMWVNLFHPYAHAHTGMHTLTHSFTQTKGGQKNGNTLQHSSQQSWQFGKADDGEVFENWTEQ